MKSVTKNTQFEFIALSFFSIAALRGGDQVLDLENIKHFIHSLWKKGA